MYSDTPAFCVGLTNSRFAVYDDEFDDWFPFSWWIPGAHAPRSSDDGKFLWMREPSYDVPRIHKSHWYD